MEPGWRRRCPFPDRSSRSSTTGVSVKGEPSSIAIILSFKEGAREDSSRRWISMRTRMPLFIIPLLSLWIAGASDAQITSIPITSNPIPTPIEKKGLAVEVRDFVRLPDTRGIRPADQDVSPAGWARVSFVKDLPDGRRFANDSRGFLYLIDSNNQPHVYADVAEAFPYGVYNPLESGFIGFVF